MQINNPKILWNIAGIGAVGSMIASSFSQSNESVRLLLKNSQQLINYQANKLSMVTMNKKIDCYPAAVNINQLDNQPIDYLISCVKAYDTTNLLLQLRHHLHEKSIIILMQNGLGILDEIREKLPQLRIISAVNTLGAYLESSFNSRISLQGELHLGRSLGEFSNDEINTVRNAFEKTILPCNWCQNIHEKLYEKFAINCGINLLTAIFSCKNGGLLSKKNLLKKLTDEIVEVLRAFNVNINKEQLFFKSMLVLETTADNYSSMYMDVHHQRRTEIPYLNEYLLKLAQKKNIEMPLNKELLNQFYVKFPEQK